MDIEPTVYCMSVTPFTEDMELDEPAYRGHMRRMAECGVSVYLAGPGTGEGHSLSDDELRRIYRIGVEACKGKSTTIAPLTEERNATKLLQKARLAVEGGVDAVQIYALDAGHGMTPTEAEQEIFYRTILDEIDYRTGLSVNVLAASYPTPIGMLKRLCEDYQQIEFINVVQPPTSYLAELIESVGPRVAFHTGPDMLAESLALGAKGCLAWQANITPYFVRSIGRLHMERRIEECGRALKTLFRLNRAVGQYSKDSSSSHWSARWVKSTMKVLGLPGHGEGRMRPPYASPSQDDIELFANSITLLDIAAIEERARRLFA